MALPYDDKKKKDPYGQVGGMAATPATAGIMAAVGSRPTPAVAAPTDNRSFGEKVGATYRNVTNAGIGATESAANAVTYPTRAAGGFLRDAVTGFTGSPSPNAGQPAGLIISLPRYGQSAPAKPAATTPASTPAVAMPGVRFAGIDAAPSNFYRNPAGVKPRNAAELDQASQAEVAARNQASRPASLPGAGAPAAGGAGSASEVVGQYNGRNITRGMSDALSARLSTVSSPGVATQNAPSVAMPNLQRPGSRAYVPSYFANDPAIQPPTDPGLPRPGGMQIMGQQGSFRGADQMAEAYNSREDREARNKLLSDLDSQRFRLEMIAGNPGRRGRAALEALGDNAQQRAALVAGGEKLSADAVQGRANRANVLANTGMEQAGQTTRQRMAGDVASQGQFLDYDARNRATNASLIDKPQYVTDLSGNLVQVAGGKWTGVTGADGSVLKMPQTTKIDNDALSAVSKELTALINNPPEMGGDATAYNARIAELRAQQAAYLGGGGAQTKPDLATFLARAKAQGSKMTEEQLKAAYANL